MAANQLTAEEASDLSLLLKAPNKALVQNVCKEAFIHRHDPVPDMTLATTATALSIEPNQASKLFSSTKTLIRLALKTGASDTTSIAKLFPDGFHDNLKALLSDIIAKSMSSWRNQTLAQQVSLPKLVDFDWRVDVKTSSDSAVKMVQPTCMVQMKVRETANQCDVLPPTQTVSMEFSPETLHTMLDGLSRIRDQLASVAAAK